MKTESTSKTTSRKRLASTLPGPAPTEQVFINPIQSPRMAYRLGEAAALMGISYITAFRLVQRGLLKSSSALRTKLIAHTEIERFLRES